MKIKFNITETLRRKQERRRKKWLAEMINSSPTISMEELENLCGEEVAQS